MSDYGGGDDDMQMEYGAGEQVVTHIDASREAGLTVPRYVGITWTI